MPKRITRPAPCCTSTMAAFPATRSGWSTQPESSTRAGSSGQCPITRTAVVSSGSNADRLSGQSASNRLCRVELEPKNRARSVEVLFARRFEHVTHRQQQRLDRESARVVQRDERSASVHELTQCFAAFGAQSARIRRGIARRQAFQNLLR